MGTILSLPYKSQYDPDAGVSRNDCGPTCLAMLLNAYGITATTDAVFRRTGASPDQYISVAQLMRVGESYGAPLEYRSGCRVGRIF
jgi:ABC-type bacteriocin/lantibiotic exporter with double-glycine peptidase domain